MITEVGAEQNMMTIVIMPSEFVSMARNIAEVFKRPRAPERLPANVLLSKARSALSVASTPVRGALNFIGRDLRSASDNGKPAPAAPRHVARCARAALTNFIEPSRAFWVQIGRPPFAPLGR